MIATTALPVNNFSAVGRTAADIFGVVVHCTAGSTVDGEIAAFLANGTSSHYTIDRDGTVYSHVPEASVAFHVAAFGNKPKLNREVNRPAWLPAFDERFSAVNAATVGIELVGFPDVGTPQSAFTDKQYTQLANLILDICARQKIPVKFRADAGNDATILAHRDVQNNRDDPGPQFGWARLKELMQPLSVPKPTLDELEVRNPNIRQQLRGWQKARVLDGQDPMDYAAFRKFQLDIHAPDPGKDEFLGFRRRRIETLEAENPKIRRQVADWQERRAEHGDDPLNYAAFREFLMATGSPDPGATEFIGFLRATLGELAARNPNIGQQLADWRQALQPSEDPLDYAAFRKHVMAIGAPDPGLTEFVGFRD